MRGYEVSRQGISIPCCNASASSDTLVHRCANISTPRDPQNRLGSHVTMSFDNSTPQATISEKCALDEVARVGDVSTVKEERTCNHNEDEAPRPTRIISGWGPMGAWGLSWGIGVNFLKLRVEAPSSIVPAMRPVSLSLLAHPRCRADVFS